MYERPLYMLAPPLFSCDFIAFFSSLITEPETKIYTDNVHIALHCLNLSGNRIFFNGGLPVAPVSVRKSQRLSSVQSDIRACPVDDAARHGAVRLLFQKMAAGHFVICSLFHLRFYSNFRRGLKESLYNPIYPIYNTIYNKNIYNKNKTLSCFNLKINIWTAVQQ